MNDANTNHVEKSFSFHPKIMNIPIQRFPVLLSISLTSVLLVGGCGSKSEGSMSSANPAEAAAELDRTFKNADAATKKNADAVSEAMKRGEFEKAVVSLQNVRRSGSLTLDQGVAVHRSVISVESELISAMESGDENARKAYQLLKQMNRN